MCSSDLASGDDERRTVNMDAASASVELALPGRPVAVVKLCILCKDSFLPIAFLVQVAASWSCLSDYEWLLLLRSVLVHASAAIDRNPPFFPAPSQTL